jgi:amino acid transporter
VSYAGFASPLVVLVAFAASLCCASSIAEFARRLPSAGSLYTYNSRGLGRTGGFLTGWMMVFAYALYVPAGIALTSAYAAQLGADVLHVTIAGWVLFLVILVAVALVACLGIRISSAVDLVLVAGEVAIIAALAVTILVRIGLRHYTAAVFSPASSPNSQLTDITNAMIYGISAFAGYEAAAALGEEARNTRRSSGHSGGSVRCGPPRRSRPYPARLSDRHTPVVAIGCVAALALAFGLPLTYAYGGAHTFGYLAGAGGLSVVLIYLAVNVATIRAF